MTEIIMSKPASGWQATTDVKLEDTPDGERFLTFTTSKSSRCGLSTTAAVYVVKDGMSTFRLYQDFFKTLLQVDVRCTEKNVRSLHQQVLDQQLASTVEAAKKHYHST